MQASARLASALKPSVTNDAGVSFTAPAKKIVTCGFAALWHGVAATTASGFAAAPVKTKHAAFDFGRQSRRRCRGPLPTYSAACIISPIATPLALRAGITIGVALSPGIRITSGTLMSSKGPAAGPGGFSFRHALTSDFVLGSFGTPIG